MKYSANKILLLITILLVSCQSQVKSIPDSAFVDVNIYFNKDSTDCSAVTAVTRKIPSMKNIEAITLGQLFEGPNEDEAQAGYSSLFSASTKDILLSFHIVDRKAYLDLKDIRSIIPNASSSCGSAELLGEMDATIKQFGTVDETLYAINGSSQDFYEWLQMEAPESFPDKF